MVSLADIADNANLTRAVRFVGHDKDDEVIRDPLSDVPFLDDLGFRLPDISRRLIARTYEPRRVKVVEVGKSNYTTRPVSFIEMEDWVVAQGILNLVAEDIDRKISPNSLAFRINPKRNESNRQKFFKSWYREWPKFVRRIRQSVSQTHPCLVVTDIAGYFEQIDLRILSDMLLTAEVPREVIDLIFTQLEKWTWRDGFVASKTRGLLQGNDVASVYANYYLSDVDEEMSGGTLIFQRFMDDINIHVASKSDGKRALSNLGIALRKKGLTLNSSKTKILEGAEIDRHFSWDVSDALEANLNDLRQLGDVVAVRHERQRLRRVILNLAVPNPHLLKRLITAYTWARDRRFVKEAVALLEANPDLTPKLTSYFRSLPTDRPLLSVVDFLDDPARNVFPAQEQALIENLLLASISRAPTQQRLAALARSKSGDLSVDPYSRALYVLLAYRCGEIVDLERLVDRYLANQEHDILPRKHLALCVTRLNDPARLQTVVDRLVQEADPSLREIGLFIHEIRHAQPNKVRTVIKRTALSLDTYYHPSTTRIARFKLRDLLLLNICRMNTQAGVRASLRQRLTAWRAKLACRVSDELIAEFIHRL